MEYTINNLPVCCSTKCFFCFLFNKRSPKDATWKTEFFAYVISWEQRAPQPKKLQSNVSQVKWSLHAKIQLFLSTFKMAKKSRGHSCTRPFISPSELYYLALCMHCRPMMREHNYFVQFSESQLDWKSTIFIQFAFRNYWAQKSCNTTSLLQNYSLSNKGRFQECWINLII